MGQMQDPQRNLTFEAWMATHQPILFKVARAYGNSAADRDDLFQEIALQVWHSIPAFRGDAAIGTWIYRVALNTAMTWLRDQKKHGRGREELGVLDALLVAAPGADPRLEWIYQRIAELDEVNRSLALLLLDGYSYREMSAILGLTESNVGVKINRIKATLAEKLAKESA
jgi:RNA polymerase sigma-70 factor (ECF subfamily)